MNKSKSYLFFLIAIFFIYTSCEGDCKDEKIEKVDWLTNYIDKTKDTLVAYSILQDKREFIQYYYSSRKEIKHMVTIKNLNRSYAGKFALRVNYNYYSTYSEEITFEIEESDYITIAPGSTYSFVEYTQAGYNTNFNNHYTILQKPVTFSYKERKDELKTEMITVNSCQENVEALREKYKEIKELFESKTDNLKSVE